MIKCFDEFFSPADHQNIFGFCEKVNYFYGETDTDGLPPTGMVCDLTNCDLPICNFLRTSVQDKVSEIKDMKLYRMYINCFAPSENPYFHTDGQTGITLLYYPNLYWDINDCGETQFIQNNEMTGVLPLPNRLVCFSANILHKATTFRNKHRFTIAFKYAPNVSG